MGKFINKHKPIIKWLLIGFFIRLILSFLFNSTFDFFNILAISKSVADTSSLVDGFFVLKRHGLEVQLYGKIYYQLIALYLQALEKIKILEIRYLFDTKAYQGPHSYLEGLFHWGPPLYQLISIKSLQFLFDAIFVYFLYQTAKLIKIIEAKKVLVFWALTPFIIIGPYAVFQSDFAMLACFIAGVFFWMKGVEENRTGFFSKNTLLTFAFLSLGAVIKQVPFLIIPFAVISFSKDIKSFILHSASAGFFYFFFNQPWDKDSSLIKQYYLMSKESTAILNFQLNSTSVFLFLYFFLLLIVLLRKNIIFQDKKNVLYITTLILSIVFTTEDSTFLFPQFNIWIMPFLALLTLIKPEFGLLFIAPILGLFKRAMIGVDLSGLLRPVFGYGFYNTLDYKDIVRGIINPDLFGLFLTTAMTVAYIYLILLVIVELFSIKQLEWLKINIKKIKLDLNLITLVIFIGYFCLFIFDFIVKTRLVIIPSQAYQLDNKKFQISTLPLEVKVSNPKGKTITDIEIRAEKNDIQYLDFTIFKFVDDKNRVIYIQKVNDFLFPVVADYFNIILNRPLKNKKFKILIYKEKGYNTISLFQAKFSGDIIGNTIYIYDNPPKEDIIDITFPKTVVDIKLRGQYEPYQMLHGVIYHLNNKPKFFVAYFSLIGLVGLAIIFLLLNCSKTA